MTRMFVAGVVVSLTCVQGVLAQPARDEVMKAEAAFVQAREKGDKTAYASLLADEFTWTTRTGTVLTKKQQLEVLQATSNPETGKDVRVYGEAAVVSGTAKLTQDGKPVAVRFVRVWAKRDNRWQAILHQGTGIAP